MTGFFATRGGGSAFGEPNKSSSLSLGGGLLAGFLVTAGGGSFVTGGLVENRSSSSSVVGLPNRSTGEREQKR